MIHLKKEVLILQMLESGIEMCGIQLVRNSNGKLGSGTIYGTLYRTENKGLISSRQERPGPNIRGTPRRFYKITALGQRILNALRREKKKP